MSNKEFDNVSSFLDISILKIKIFDNENIKDSFYLCFDINGIISEEKIIKINEIKKEINLKIKLKDDDLKPSIPIYIKCYKKFWLIFNKEIASIKFLFNFNRSFPFRQWFYLKNLNEDNILSLLISIKFHTNNKIIPCLTDEIRLDEIINLISNCNKKIIENENKLKKKNLNANLIMNNYFENIKKLEKQRRKFEDNIKEFNRNYFKIENREKELSDRKKVYKQKLYREELEDEIMIKSKENFENLNYILININYNITEETKKNYYKNNSNNLIDNNILFKNSINTEFDKEAKLSLISKESFKNKFSTSTNLTSKNNSETSFSGIISPFSKDENKKIKIISYEYHKIDNHKSPKLKKEKIYSQSNIMGINIPNNIINFKISNQDNNSNEKKERKKKKGNTISLNSYKSSFTNIPMKPIHSFFNFNFNLGESINQQNKNKKKIKIKNIN